MTPLELAAAAVTLVSVWLTVKESIWCWPVGLVGVALFAAVFYEAKLYANMGLQAVFAALSIYGWHHWLHGGRGRGELAVRRAEPRRFAALLVLGAALSLGLGAGFARFSDAASPYLDSTLTAFSIVAQWTMSRKLVESWIVWIAVDVGSILLYLTQHLYATAALYAVFLVLAARGLSEWKQSARAAAAA